MVEVLQVLSDHQVAGVTMATPTLLKNNRGPGVLGSEFTLGPVLVENCVIMCR